MLEIRSATTGDRKIISELLANAFVDDPVVRWLMPKRGRDARMFRVLTSYVHAAPGGAELAFENGEAVGVSLWDPPGYRPTVRQQVAGALGFLRSMGAGARRGMALEATFGKHKPAGEYWYLAQLGAPTPGRGVGSALLEHRLSTIDGPAYLESSAPANLPLYERFGFRVTKEFDLPAGGPPVWGMLRE